MTMPVPIGAGMSPPGRGALTVADLAEQLQTVAQEQARLQAALTRIAGLLPLATAQQVVRPVNGRAEYLTVADVAKLLKVDRTTIYAWMVQKGLPFQYVGTRRRIRCDTLEAWVAEQADGPR